MDRSRHHITRCSNVKKNLMLSNSSTFNQHFLITITAVLFCLSSVSLSRTAVLLCVCSHGHCFSVSGDGASHTGKFHWCSGSALFDLREILQMLVRSQGRLTNTFAVSSITLSVRKTHKTTHIKTQAKYRHQGLWKFGDHCLSTVCPTRSAAR